MKPITPELLARLSTKEKPELMAPLASAMNEFFPVFAIDTELRQENFLPQALHEADGFHTLQEYASGDAYDTRTDLGNTAKKDGDGRKYKGRGIFQTTGKANYTRAQKEMAKYGVELDLIKHPELLLEPRNAVLSACIYWDDHGLNALADKDDIKAITRKINGGYNGLDDRIRYRDKCRLAITRDDATVASLRAQGSTTIKGADQVQRASLLATVGAGGSTWLSQAEIASDYWRRVKEILGPFYEEFGWLLSNPIFYVSIVAGIAAYYAHKVKLKRLEEHKIGKVQ